MGFNIKGFLKDIYKQAGSMAGIGTGIGKGSVSDQQEPSDVDILALDVISGDTVTSLAAVVKEINLYESILSPAIFCDLSVYDANDLYTQVGFQKEITMVKVAFKSPATKKVNEYVLLVDDILDYKQVGANMGATYTLRCVSAEIIQNRKINYYNDNLNDLPEWWIEGILKIWLESSKKFNVHKKSDISVNEIFAQTKPFVAIDELRKFSVTHDHISSCFVFYEDCDGYHFNTIENMIEQQKTIFGNDASDKIFYFDARRNQDDTASGYRTILAFKEISSGPVSEDDVRLRIKYWDPVAGGPEQRQLDSKDVASAMVAMDPEGKNLRSNKSLASGKASIAAELLSVIPSQGSTNIPDRLAPEVIINRQNFLSNLLRHMKHMYIYGDNTIRIGNMISVNFVIPVDLENRDGPMRRVSGQYMVGKIRHMILNDDRPKYTMALEIFKSGVQGD